MKKNTYRLIFLSLFLLLGITISLGVNFYQNNDETIELPTVIEGISPLPNYQVPQQTSIEINLPVDYEIVLIVNNYIIPSSEILNVEATGVFEWKPGPNKTFETWKAGEQNIRVTWSKVVGLPDVGEFSWTFYINN
ncbi:MAG: hypothetical protein ACR2L5_03195 [Candidatus Actinomarinaceae bacterium]